MAVLIDEEGIPRDDMEGAYEDVRKLLKQRIDDFLNAFNLQPLIAVATSQGTITPQSIEAAKSRLSQQSAEKTQRSPRR